MKRHDQRNVETMEMEWGRGHMSSGGGGEVARIAAGLDLRDQRVPDLGCGLGEAGVVPARASVSRLGRGRQQGVAKA